MWRCYVPAVTQIRRRRNGSQLKYAYLLRHCAIPQTDKQKHTLALNYTLYAHRNIQKCKCLFNVKNYGLTVIYIKQRAQDTNRRVERTLRSVGRRVIAEITTAIGGVARRSDDI